MPASTSWCRTLATHLGHLTMTPTNPNCGAADAMRWLLKRELFYTAVTLAKAKIDGGAFGNADECITPGWTSGWSFTTACTTRFKPCLPIRPRWNTIRCVATGDGHTTSR